MAKSLRIYRDFSGGLSEVANDNMTDNQLVLAINTTPAEGYGIAKCHGYEIAFPQVPGGEEIVEMLSLKPAAGATQTLVFTPTALYKLIPAFDETPAQWSQLASGLSIIRDYFIQAHKLYWLDEQKYRVYDGVDVGEVTFKYAGSTPTAEEQNLTDRIKTSSYVEQRGQRWFFARAGYNEVIYSKIGDPTAFEITSIINVNTRNADTITALREFNDGLLIYKEKSVHYFEGWDFAGGSDIKLTQLNVTSGTKFNKTVQLVENAILYLGYNGVYRLRIPNLSVTIAADNIADRLVADTLTEEEINNAYACVWDGVYRLTIETAKGLREYRYYIGQRAFFGEYTQGCYCYSSGLEENVLFLGCANGYILRDDPKSYHYIDTDTGEPMGIPMKAKTKSFDVAGLMAADARIKRIFIIAKQFDEESSKPSLTMQADYQTMAFDIDLDESLVWDEGSWGKTYWGYIDTITKEIPVNFKAKRLQYTVENNALDEPVLIYGLAVLYKTKRPRANREGVTGKAVDYDTD